MFLNEEIIKLKANFIWAFRSIYTGYKLNLNLPKTFVLQKLKKKTKERSSHTVEIVFFWETLTPQSL